MRKAHEGDCAVNATASRTRVLIATTEGPVEIESLLEEDAALGRSVVCIAGGTETAGIDRDYHAFVARGTGLIARLYGHECFRLDVSSAVDVGSSWQLGVFAAHALHAAGRLAHKSEDAETIVLATGRVRPLDQSVQEVGHLDRKLSQAIERLEAETASGRRIIVVLPRGNAATISHEMEARLERLGAEVVPLDTIHALIRALRLPAAVAGALPTKPVRCDSAAERRQLTVLFCDLVGSTALASKLDPEDTAEIIRLFQTTCAAAIERAGGYVAKFMGDGVLAYFGYPRAHDDDAQCAVRAGLDLVKSIGQAVLPSGAPMQVRVGIATGLVIVGEIIGEGSSKEQSVVGEAPNLAARLQALASASSVLIAASTHRLIGGEFLCEDLGPQELKGIEEPVPVWRVLGEQAVDDRFEAARGTKLTNFVGRTHELEQLAALWEQAKLGQGQVVLLSGEAGIGKSRIGKTFRDRIGEEPHFTIRYQCSPRHTNSPWYPVITQIEHAAGFEREDTPAAKRAKLESVLFQAGQAVLADAALYAALLSIPFEECYPELDLTRQRQKDLTIAVLVRQLIALSKSRPVLFIVEDVHWIDPTTLELVNRAIETITTSRVLVLMTFRPEFFPPWLNEHHVTMLQLHRIARDQAGAMIADLTRGKSLPPEIVDHILRKTDGIPLFVEELTKTVLESGLLRDAGDRYAVDGPLPPLAIPTTLQDSLMARLDRLAPVKEISQIGAAIGREFSYRLLTFVAPTSGRPLQEALAHLTAAGLISARGEPPDAIYIFKHALVQDAAYASVLRSKRQQLHGRIASILKEEFPETVETQPEVVAHHLAQAGLIEPAIDYLQKAGHRAIQRSAAAEAIGHLKRALELLQSLTEGSDKRRRVALVLETLLGQAMMSGRGWAAPETREVMLRARALIDESTHGSEKFSVLYGIWATYYIGGGTEQRQAAEEFLRAAQQHEEVVPILVGHRIVGTSCVNQGDFSTGRRHLERAVTLYDPVGHAGFRLQYSQDIGVAAMCYLSWALWQLGCIEQASQVADEAMKHAEKSAHPFTLASAIFHTRAMMTVFGRRADSTTAYAERVVSLSTEHGFPFWAAGGRVLAAWAMACQGDAKAGVKAFQSALTAWKATGTRLWLPMFLALEAEACAKAGDHDAALCAIENAIVTADETGERWAVAEILRIKAGLLLAQSGANAKEAEAVLGGSLDIAVRQQARCWEMRAVGDLARLWAAEGRREEASELLRAKCAQSDEGSVGPDLVDAQTLFAELS